MHPTDELIPVLKKLLLSGVLQDEHGEDLERIALLCETLGGRGAASLEARSPPMKIIWFAALLALAALRAGLRSSCDGSAGEDAIYERGRE